jgi:cytidine deaminase
LDCAKVFLTFSDEEEVVGCKQCLEVIFYFANAEQAVAMIFNSGWNAWR